MIYDTPDMGLRYVCFCGINISLKSIREEYDFKNKRFFAQGVATPDLKSLIANAPEVDLEDLKINAPDESVRKDARVSSNQEGGAKEVRKVGKLPEVSRPKDGRNAEEGGQNVCAGKLTKVDSSIPRKASLAPSFKFKGHKLVKKKDVIGDYYEWRER